MADLLLAARMSIPVGKAEEARARVGSAFKEIARDLGGEVLDVCTWDQVLAGASAAELQGTVVPMDLQSMYQPATDLPDDLDEEL